MRAAAFTKPVSVFVGLGFPKDVENVWQAYQLVNDWPHATSGQRIALAACRAGLAGEVSADDVRAAVESFARQAGILADEALEVTAMAHAREWLDA